MRKLVMTAICLGVLLGTSTVSALAATPTTGQPGAPNHTCGPANTITPGAAVSAPGSAFNPTGQAGNVYAGNPGTASATHSNSTVAVSQYDTACVRLSH
jgi:hypothetical protein